MVVQRELLLAMWYHFALPWRAMISDVKRWDVQQNKILIMQINLTLLTAGCQPRCCIQQTQPSVSLG